MKQRLGIVIVGLVLTLPLASQERPDFSGTWRLDDAKSDPVSAPKPRADGRPGPPPGSRPTMLVVVQTADTLTIDETGPKGVRRFRFKLDGTESTNWTGPIQMKSRASWESDKLVFSTTNSVEYDNFGSSREVYSLRDGSLVVEKTLNRRDGTIITTKLVFVKLTAAPF
jgi:hypothetical protein